MLKWIVDRIEGRVEAEETVVGYTALYEDLDTDGLSETEEDIREALSVNPAVWGADLADNEEWLKILGDRVPSEVWDEFNALKERVEAATAE